MILHKEMKRLYLNKYQYRMVLVLDSAWIFRGKNLNLARERALYFQDQGHPTYRVLNALPILSLIDVLESIEDFTVRVERCYLSLYFTKQEHVSAVSNIMGSYVKEIYEPKVPLTENSVISSLPFDYKVHLRVNGNYDYNGFINWAEQTDKVRVPAATKRRLLHDSFYVSNVYFYITGEKQLTLARMYLGASIVKIEKIINP